MQMFVLVTVLMNVFKCWLRSVKEKHSCTDGSSEMATASQSAKPDSHIQGHQCAVQQILTQDTELLRV